LTSWWISLVVVDLAKAERANFFHALETKVKKIIRNILRRANQPKADRLLPWRAVALAEAAKTM
jgi:hypothetical protein